jgi:hypothetical protein
MRTINDYVLANIDDITNEQLMLYIIEQKYLNKYTTSLELRDEVFKYIRENKVPVVMLNNVLIIEENAYFSFKNCLMNSVIHHNLQKLIWSSNLVLVIYNNKIKIIKNRYGVHDVDVTNLTELTTYIFKQIKDRNIHDIVKNIKKDKLPDCCDNILADVRNKLTPVKLILNIIESEGIKVKDPRFTKIWDDTINQANDSIEYIKNYK